MNIDQIIEDHQHRLMAIPGVTGVGIGNKDNQPVIVVMVKESTQQLKAALPPSIEGHPVVIEQSGEISAF